MLVEFQLHLQVSKQISRHGLKKLEKTTGKTAEKTKRRGVWGKRILHACTRYIGRENYENYRIKGAKNVVKSYVLDIVRDNEYSMLLYTLKK